MPNIFLNKIRSYRDYTKRHFYFLRFREIQGLHFIFYLMNYENI